VSSDRDELPSSTQVGVKLVLEIDEALVASRSEGLLEPEDRSSEEGSDLGDGSGDVNGDELLGGGSREGVVGRKLEVEENSESESETFDAEEIISEAH